VWNTTKTKCITEDEHAKKPTELTLNLVVFLIVNANLDIFGIALAIYVLVLIYFVKISLELEHITKAPYKNAYVMKITCLKTNSVLRAVITVMN
jgi:hypothetical protein